MTVQCGKVVIGKMRLSSKCIFSHHKEQLIADNINNSSMLK